MPVINRKRPRGGARASSQRVSRGEEEDHDMNQESQGEDEEEEATPARRRGHQQQQQHQRQKQRNAPSLGSSGGRDRQMKLQGRRHAQEETEEEDEEEEEEEEEEEKDESALRHKNKRRRRRDDGDDEDGGDENGEKEDEDGEERGKGNDPVAKFVRLALACEYQKKPIRRPEITEKVLMPHHKNDFKVVFEETQAALRNTFGMELVELPANKEKMTLNQQRRAAAQEAANPGAKKKKASASESSTSNKQWVLTSVLPDEYRDPELIAPDQDDELALHGFGMMIVAMVYLSKKALGDKTLDKYLKRFKAEESIAVEGPGDTGRTDTIIADLVKNSYLVKVKDDVPAGSEQTFTYKIGPRAKVEMGDDGVMKLAKLMYGEEAPNGFERMVKRSIGQDQEQVEAEAKAEAAEKEAEEEGGGARRGRDGEARRGRGGGRTDGGRAAGGSSGRRRRGPDDSDGEEEEQEEEEEEEEDEESDDDDSD